MPAEVPGGEGKEPRVQGKIDHQGAAQDQIACQYAVLRQSDEGEEIQRQDRHEHLEAEQQEEVHPDAHQDLVPVAPLAEAHGCVVQQDVPRPHEQEQQ